MYTDPLLVYFLSRAHLPNGATPAELLPALLEKFSAIPYENLTKVIGVKESGATVFKQSPEQVLAGFFDHGTGGTCFPLTATLVRLLRSLMYEAHPILADRRYGPDTHCAVVARLSPHAWSLIDPGYLITAPIEIPRTHPHRSKTSFNEIELRPHVGTSRVDLFTVEGSAAKYRLTYKVEPVDDASFHAAWNASFSWEMMTYPIVSGVRNSTQVYLQKNRILLRTHEARSSSEMGSEALASEVAATLGIDISIVRKAFSYLLRQP